MPLAESRGRVVVARRGAKECLDPIGRVSASCSVENESAWTPVAVLAPPEVLLTSALSPRLVLLCAAAPPESARKLAQQS